MEEADGHIQELQESVRSGRLRALARQMPTVLGATVINALLAAALVVSAGNRQGWLWLAGILALTAARAAFWWRLRTGTGFRRLSLLSSASAGAAGMLWGALALMAFPAPETYELLIAIIISGMCAGAVVAYGAHFASAAAFILPATLPLALRFLLDGQPLRHLMAAMVTVFAAGMLRVAWVSHRNVGAVLRLEAELSRRTAALDGAGARLEVELARNQATVAALQHVQRMQAAGQFASGIAHDVNNMLAAIQFALYGIIAATGGEGAVSQHVKAAESAVESSARLIASLLGFVRPGDSSAAPARVTAMITDFLPLLRRAAAPCLLETDLADGLPDCAIGTAQFQSAILNLVINAHNASPGGGTVTIAATLAAPGDAAAAGYAGAASGSGRFVAVSVADTGCGMAEDVAARAFDPFYTTGPPGKASGLGLAQVLAFARDAGGHAALRSTPGAGTVVTVFLPERQDALAADTHDGVRPV